MWIFEFQTCDAIVTQCHNLLWDAHENKLHLLRLQELRNSPVNSDPSWTTTSAPDSQMLHLEKPGCLHITLRPTRQFTRVSSTRKSSPGYWARFSRRMSLSSDARAPKNCPHFHAYHKEMMYERLFVILDTGDVVSVEEHFDLLIQLILLVISKEGVATQASHNKVIHVVFSATYLELYIALHIIIYCIPSYHHIPSFYYHMY